MPADAAALAVAFRLFWFCIFFLFNNQAAAFGQLFSVGCASRRFRLIYVKEPRRLVLHSNAPKTLMPESKRKRNKNFKTQPLRRTRARDWPMKIIISQVIDIFKSHKTDRNEK